MKKKLLAVLLSCAVMTGISSANVFAEEKTFVYGTTGYSEEMGGRRIKSS